MDPLSDEAKELLAVSSITNEIKSSVHSLLLAGSPRTTPSPRVDSKVLSVWNGLVRSHSHESPVPGSSWTLGSMPSSSPQTGPSSSVPHSSSTHKLQSQRSGSPRNRFYPAGTATRSDDGCTVCDLKPTSLLEDERPCSSIVAEGNPEARLQIDVGCTSGHAAYCAGSPFLAASPGRAEMRGNSFSRSFSGALPSTSKPPKPPRSGRKGGLKHESQNEFRILPQISGQSLGYLSQSRSMKLQTRLQLAVAEARDRFTSLLMALLLTALFIVLLLFQRNDKTKL